MSRRDKHQEVTTETVSEIEAQLSQRDSAIEALPEEAIQPAEEQGASDAPKTNLELIASAKRETRKWLKIADANHGRQALQVAARRAAQQIDLFRQVIEAEEAIAAGERAKALLAGLT